MITPDKNVRAVPPGEKIKEQIRSKHMSQKELAARMGMSEKHISHLMNGLVELTSEAALKLETVLGVPAAFWNSLEADYRTELLKAAEAQRIEDETRFLRELPVEAMARAGWIRQEAAPLEKIRELRKFFGVTSLLILRDSGLFKQVCLKQLSESEKRDWVFLSCWQQARSECRATRVEDLNLPKLKASLNQIKAKFSSEPDLIWLRDLLASCGVFFTVLPDVFSAYARGAAFYDGKKAVVFFTAGKPDTGEFLFSLFREIGRIVLGHPGKEQSDELRKQADDFAEQSLIDRGQFEEFARGGDFTEASVRRFSDQAAIAPGITALWLQQHGFVERDRLNELKKQISLFIPKD